MELKKILFDADTVKKLKEVFGCDPKTIYNALDGVHQSEQSLRIRHLALKMGLREKGEEQIKVLQS